MMSWKWLAGVMALTAAQAAVAHAEPGKDYPPAWPRPGATLLVESDRGAAYVVTYPKGEQTAVHRHRYAFAGLDLNTATMGVKTLDGQQMIFPVIKNRMWFLPKDLIHSEVSLTTPGRHAVMIDIKDKTAPEAVNMTSLPTDRYSQNQIKVLENDQVVIWDCAWPEGVDGVASFDSRDMFLAFAEGGDLSIASTDQPGHVQHFEAGQAIFLPGGQARTFAAVHGTIHAMLVAVK
jgi:hypothetical protein